MYPKLVENLIEYFVKLPGVGRRSAERMVFWILNCSVEEAREMAGRIVDLKEGLKLCRHCHNLSETDECLICGNPGRDRSTICVVEDHKHLLAIERSGSYKGLYYVLMGAISPADGKGPEDLPLALLKERITSQDIKEVVIATDPDSEGEMTSLHITQELKPMGIKISRIGLGIPIGSSVEYADISTLTMSMTSRKEM